MQIRTKSGRFARRIHSPGLLRPKRTSSIPTAATHQPQRDTIVSIVEPPWFQLSPTTTSNVNQRASVCTPS
ncbi:hypothetical protein CDV36_015376 [Fusarium kuroshium]|uniref:Uncharacterized protein n=2 Tax=Fusarium solani species complex TaxID=232080 RepID=A0A3M2RAL5_9HYPO|nr:hypothetical protein CDV36_015376 [Fusarium kuroshium]RSM03578.1 hypothetical protein CEP52_007329 [Fusarium oligoseptatum]